MPAPGPVTVLESSLRSLVFNGLPLKTRALSRPWPGTGLPQQSAAVRAGEASSSSRAKRPARRRFSHLSIILAALEQYEDSLLTPRGQSSPGPPTGFIEATLTAPFALLASPVCVPRSLPPPGRGRDGGRGRSEAVRAEQLWESGGRKIGSCWLLEREVSGKKGPGRDRPLPTRADGAPRVAPGLPCSPRLLGWRPS